MNNKKNVLLGGLLAFSVSVSGSPAMAAVPAGEAARLGQDLTPFGSVRAGNAAGTIPPWTGGLTPEDAPAGYRGSGQHHLNPDLTRWELHRVHVVEATLKEGERHIYGKRRFYVDADSWNTLLLDQYDGRGELWRVTFGMAKNYYELPGVA